MNMWLKRNEFCQGVGKTTLITRVLETLKISNPNLKVQGFYTSKFLSVSVWIFDDSRWYFKLWMHRRGERSKWKSWVPSGYIRWSQGTSRLFYFQVLFASFLPALLSYNTLSLCSILPTHLILHVPISCPFLCINFIHLHFTKLFDGGYGIPPQPNLGSGKQTINSISSFSLSLSLSICIYLNLLHIIVIQIINPISKMSLSFQLRIQAFVYFLIITVVRKGNYGIISWSITESTKTEQWLIQILYSLTAS